ncbi:hypothetical protein K438DRAFT_1753347 [Mycena galopus ATCC 62051]|nr:hypothetical protein K438DRAFT_1753347 [Mycena galopus ATCC 62051]
MAGLLVIGQDRFSVRLAARLGRSLDGGLIKPARRVAASSIWTEARVNDQRPGGDRPESIRAHICRESSWSRARTGTLRVDANPVRIPPTFTLRVLDRDILAMILVSTGRNAKRPLCGGASAELRSSRGLKSYLAFADLKTSTSTATEHQGWAKGGQPRNFQH